MEESDDSVLSELFDFECNFLNLDFTDHGDSSEVKTGNLIIHCIINMKDVFIILILVYCYIL